VAAEWRAVAGILLSRGTGRRFCSYKLIELLDLTKWANFPLNRESDAESPGVPKEGYPITPRVTTVSIVKKLCMTIVS
jgi:hypothetical protein